MWSLVRELVQRWLFVLESVKSDFYFIKPLFLCFLKMGGKPGVTRRGTIQMSKTLAEYPFQREVDNEAFGKIKVCRKKQAVELSLSQAQSNDTVLIVKEFILQSESEITRLKQEIEDKRNLRSNELSSIVDFCWEFVGNRVCGSYYKFTIAAEFCEFSLLSEIKKRRRVHNTTPKGSKDYSLLVIYRTWPIDPWG